MESNSIGNALISVLPPGIHTHTYNHVHIWRGVDLTWSWPGSWPVVDDVVFRFSHRCWLDEGGALIPWRIDDSSDAVFTFL